MPSCAASCVAEPGWSTEVSSEVRFRGRLSGSAHDAQSFWCLPAPEGHKGTQLVYFHVLLSHCWSVHWSSFLHDYSMSQCKWILNIVQEFAVYQVVIYTYTWKLVFTQAWFDLWAAEQWCCVSDGEGTVPLPFLPTFILPIWGSKQADHKLLAFDTSMS